MPIALAAAIAATTLPGVARETAIAYITTAAAVVAGFTYILWDDLTYVLDEHQSTTPIPRAVGSIVLLSTVLAPLLIQPLLRRRLRSVEGEQRWEDDNDRGGPEGEDGKVGRLPSLEPVEPAASCEESGG